MRVSKKNILKQGDQTTTFCLHSSERRKAECEVKLTVDLPAIRQIVANSVKRNQLKGGAESKHLRFSKKYFETR